MPTAKRTALVTGASGLASGYMVAHLLEQGGWGIVAASRRQPRIPGDYRCIFADLLDPADCRTKLGPLSAAKRPIQVRRCQALLDARVAMSSILERKVLRIGDVLAL